jgi:hypothetical protein
VTELIEKRRASDARIDTLVTQMHDVQVELKANTEITKQVADVLASFRVINNVAKWFVPVAAACTAAWHAIQGWKGH